MRKFVKPVFRLISYLAMLFLLITTCPVKGIGQELKNEQMFEKEIIFEYSDGNANLWLISKDSIDYKPVIAEESSSGFYTGGKAKSQQLKPDDFSEIEQLFNQIFENKLIQIQGRIKPSGMLIKKEKGKSIQKVFFKNGAEMQKLDTFLNKIIR